MEINIPSPKITIIIPAYGHELYISAAIASVLNQTFSDFELIVIDDASPDNTWQVIQGFQDSRLKTFRHESNQGAVETITKHGHEFIFTDVELIDDQGQIIQDQEHGWLKWLNGLKEKYNQTSDVSLVLLSGNVAVSTSNMFFSAEVLKRIGYFHEYRYAHDYDFILRYLADPEAKLRFLTGKMLMSCRLHGSNIGRGLNL